MNKKYIYTLTLIVFLLFPVMTHAETAETTPDVSVDATTSGTPSRKPSRDIVEKKMVATEEKKTEFKTDLEARREEAKAKFETKREEFEAKMAEMKDEKKAAIIERVDTRLREKNADLTDRLLKHLVTVSEILDRIETRASEVGNTDVEGAVADARTAIEEAQAAVEVQAGKVYIVTITDEETAKTAVSTVVEEFRSDIKATAETVKAARKSTVEAARVLRASRELITN